MPCPPIDRRVPLALALAIALVDPGPAAAEVAWHAWGVVLAEIEQNRPAFEPRNDNDGRPLPDTRFELRINSHRIGALAGIGAAWEPTPGVLVFGAFDTGLVPIDPLTDPPTGRTFAEDAARTWLIRALGVELIADDGRTWSLSVGKQRLIIGGGLLVDTAALGADAAFESEDLGLTLGVWWPGRQAPPDGWPIVRAAVEWRPDPFVKLRIFGAATRFDGDRGRRLVAPAIQSRLVGAAERLVDDWLQGRLSLPGLGGAQVGALDQLVDRVVQCADFGAQVAPAWLGVEADALLDGHTLRATAMIGGGSGQIEPRIDPACPRLADLTERLVPPRRFELAGLGFDARWRTRLHRRAYVGAFAMGMSGHPPGDGTTRLETFGALLAPAPLVERPGLIFGGGLGAELGERPAVAYGYEGRGLIGGGPTALFVPHEAVEIDLMAAPLWTAVQQRVYGWELDATVRWQPTEALVVRSHGAWLWPGDAFPSGGPWWRLALTVEGGLP